MQAEEWADAQHAFLERVAAGEALASTEVKVIAFLRDGLPIGLFGRETGWWALATMGRTASGREEGINVFVFAPTVAPGARPILEFTAADMAGAGGRIATRGTAVGELAVNGNFVIRTDVGTFSPIWNPMVPHRWAPSWAGEDPLPPATTPGRQEVVGPAEPAFRPRRRPTWGNPQWAGAPRWLRALVVLANAAVFAVAYALRVSTVRDDNSADASGGLLLLVIGTVAVVMWLWALQPWVPPRHTGRGPPG